MHNRCQLDMKHRSRLREEEKGEDIFMGAASTGPVLRI